jgi:hypothetical protein
MAMKKSTPKPPTPPRMSGTGVSPSRTPSKIPTGRRPTKPVVKVQPKGAVKKSAVRNPSAPKPVGSGTSVTLLNKAESVMKRDKAAGRNRSGQSMNKSKSPNKSYKTKFSDSLTNTEQRVKGTPDRGSMSSYNDLKARDAMMRSAAGGKGQKTSGMTPPKKTPPTPKRKGRIFVGRGGAGGMGGGGLFGGRGLGQTR